jgi:hypothetical protein
MSVAGQRIDALLHFREHYQDFANPWHEPENPFAAVAHLNARGAYAKTNARQVLVGVGAPASALGPDFGPVR